MTIFDKNPASPEVVEAMKKDGMTVVEVTIKRVYILHTPSHIELAALMQEWFVRYRGRSHAYRDGSLVGGTDVVQEIKNLTTGETVPLSNDSRTDPTAG